MKGGAIAMAAMGDPNASIPTPQPVHYRPMFAGFGRSLTQSCVTFVSRAAREACVAQKYGLDAAAACGRPTRAAAFPSAA